MDTLKYSQLKMNVLDNFDKTERQKLSKQDSEGGKEERKAAIKGNG